MTEAPLHLSGIFSRTSHSIRIDALAITLPIALVSYLLYQRLLSPLAKFKGPLLPSLTRWWLVFHSYKGGMEQKIPALHKRYGKIVRIAPNELSVNEPSEVLKIYAAGTKFRKSDWYSVWQGHRKFDLFPERNEDIHRKGRRTVARPYSLDVMLDTEQYVDSAVTFFCRRMDELRTNGPIDMASWAQLFAFDVIGEVTFSKRFGFMDSGKHDGIFDKIWSIMGSASWLGQADWIYWLHDALMPYIGNRLAVNVRHGGLRDFVVNEVKERQARASDRKDFVTKLIAIHHERPNEFPEPDVVSMLTSNINAGSDTTAAIIRGIIYEVLRNPEVKLKLVAEIDNHRDQGNVSDIVQFKETKTMEYLQAVIWEGLRLWPPIAMNMPRVVPKEGAVIDGIPVPAGMIVGAHAYVINRDPSIYGEEPDEFKPERWLRDHETVGQMHRYLLTFGSGARICIGKNISILEITKLIPTLFMRYDIKLAHPERPWKTTSNWMLKQEDMDVVLTSR